MTTPDPRPSAEPGRHRRRRRTRQVLVVTGLAVAVGVASASVAAFAGDKPAASACAARSAIRVVVAPELADVVTSSATTVTARCTRVVVTAADPADTAAALARGENPADVWIPDSSVWPGRIPALAESLADAQSLASSPVVLAVPAGQARRLGPAPTAADVIAAATGAHPWTVSVPDPERSAASQAALYDLGAALGNDPVQRGLLAGLLRSMDTHGTTTLPVPVEGSPVARVTTEQAVRAANAAAGAPAYRAVRSSASTSLDYPYVVLGHRAVQDAVAASLLRALTGPDARTALTGLGLRPPLPRSTDVAAPAVLTTGRADAALEAVRVLARPTRTLALVDVSGSMALPVPGAHGASRMDLAREAILQGMALLPQDTVAGLWRFSSNLTPSTDYQQLAPMSRLAGATRTRLAGAVRGLTVDADGGTGLYASTLAAVRAVRTDYDPTRVNSVIVLSDGKDQDATAHGISLSTLLHTLRAEADPQRPVIVIAVAYGPDSDAGAMRAISSATGGTLYTARDPRDLPVILREALGQRLCSPSC